MPRAGPERRGPAPSGIVTLLTDFGLDDAYVGIVKGVILAINPAARLVDLTHAVPPQDVLRGALALEAAYRFFPRGTVHLAVVDPGVGGPRPALALAADGHYFVGPDNGLFGFLLTAPRLRAVTLANPAYHRLGGAVSRTFHARDVFAPAAAHCSLGVPLERFGPPARNPVRRDWPRPSRRGRRLIGRILLADRFGNLLTNLAQTDLPGPRADCVLEVGGQRIEGIAGTYGERPLRALGSVVDSSGRVEIFVRDGSAQDRLGVGPGAVVSLWSTRSSRTRSPRKTFPRTRSPRRTARGSRARSRSRRSR